MSAPAVAVSTKHKKFAVAWKDMRMKEPNIYWSISDSPGFKSEAIVHSTARGEQDHPSLAIDESGNVWVAWEDTRTGKRAIRIRSDRDNAERAITGPNDPSAGYPVLASSGDTTAVVFEVGNGKNKEVRFVRIN
jgi:hypothetical protein